MSQNGQCLYLEENLRIAPSLLTKEFLNKPVLDGFETEISKSGLLTISVLRDDKRRYIHSKYDPEKEAELFAETLDIQKKSIIICFGLGLGYYAMAMLKHLGSDGELHIIEPMEEVLYFYASMNLLQWMGEEKRLHFNKCLIEKDYADAMGAMYGFGVTDRVIITAIPAYADLFSEDYKKFLAAYRDVYNDRSIAQSTLRHYAQDWQAAVVKNLSKQVCGYNLMQFMDRWKNQAVVMVAAGPSLNKNVALLKKIKGIIPIVCVYTAYKVLRKYGIEPDIVISIDAHQLIHETVEERSEKLCVPLICMSISDERLIEKHYPRMFFIPSNLDSLFAAICKKLKKECLTLETGGSVACTAMAFSYFTGANPIIMLGQDLAFTGNKTHADGTFYDGRNELDQSQKYMWIEDINGDQVPTDSAFYSFKTWFDMFVQAHNEERTFIDATEGGAKIKGTEIMTFREVIDKYCANVEGDVDKDIEDVFNEGRLFSPEERVIIVDLVREVTEGFQGLREVLPSAVEASEKMVKIYEKKEQNRRAKAIRGCIKKMDAVDVKIKGMKEKVGFFDIVFQKIYMDLMNFDLEGKLDEETYIAHRQYMLYRYLDLIITFITPELEKALVELDEVIKQDKEQTANE